MRRFCVTDCYGKRTYGKCTAYIVRYVSSETGKNAIFSRFKTRGATSLENDTRFIVHVLRYVCIIFYTIIMTIIIVVS